MSRLAGSRRDAPSFIGAGLKIDGDMRGEGEVYVAGAITGNVAVRKLMLHPGSALDGTAKAETAVINGAMKGRIVADAVALESAAQVSADITYTSLRVEAGAEFVGQSRHAVAPDASPLPARLEGSNPRGNARKRIAIVLLGIVLIGAPLVLPKIEDAACGGPAPNLCSVLQSLPWGSAANPPAPPEDESAAEPGGQNP